MSESRLFMLAAPMAWGKDTVIRRLVAERGGRSRGRYLLSLPGQMYLKGKMAGRPRKISSRPCFAVGRKLIVMGMSDGGRPDALIHGYAKHLGMGRSVLAQSRLLGADTSPSYVRALMEAIGPSRVTWLRPSETVDLSEMAKRMSARGNKEMATCIKICEWDHRQWKNSVRLIRVTLASGAREVELPTGTFDEQYCAVESVLGGELAAVRTT